MVLLNVVYMYDLSLITPSFCLLRDTLRLRQATCNVLYAFGVWVFMSGVRLYVCWWFGDSELVKS